MGEAIDQVIEQDPKQRKVSISQAVKAMVLNGLGFVNQRLYLVPKFFENKPTQRLVGPGIAAEHLNDDCLGRALDALYETGVTPLFAQLSHQAAQRLGLAPRFGHLDSSSFHVDGQYNSEAEPEVGVVHITPGYSRDHRPELNQVMLNLIVEHQAGLPLLMEPLSGNSSDKTEFKRVIETHLKQLQPVSAIEYLVADSAMYTQQTLQSLGERKWITRVPETLKEAKEAIATAASEQLTELDAHHRYQLLNSSYAGIAQRWLLIESEAAQKRAMKTVSRQVKQGSAQELKAFDKLLGRHFACAADAEHALAAFQAHLKWTAVQGPEIMAVAPYHGPGRPAQGQAPNHFTYQIRGALATCLASREARITQKSRFILATNELDPEKLPPKDLLAAYKGQGRVERGFRFLKDPMFLASSLFLKSTHRVMALLMVMTLCLLVYAALEYRLRQALKAHDQSFPNQKGQPIQNPTVRWVFQCFVGIHLLIIHRAQALVLNLQEHHRLLLTLLGEHYEAFYS